jgi:hypothetical protein
MMEARTLRYLHDSDHINCWYRAHEHVLRATMGAFQAARRKLAASSLCPPVMAIIMIAVRTSTL